MANEIFRRRLQTAVLEARREYSDSAVLDHAGVRGRVREIVASNLLSRVLPSPFELGTGKIVDWRGTQSSETDIIVYSKSVLAPILYSSRDGVFPLEACFLSIEVKSRLTSSELADAVFKAKRLRDLSYLPGLHTDTHQSISHSLTPVISVLFAFESDLSSKNELERYSEHDAEWLQDPILRAICVVGRGYYWFHKEREAWIVHPPTVHSDEVVDFLALASNTCMHSLQRRGRPRFGKYLISDRPLGVVRTTHESMNTTAIADDA